MAKKTTKAIESFVDIEFLLESIAKHHPRACNESNSSFREALLAFFLYDQTCQYLSNTTKEARFLVLTSRQASETCMQRHGCKATRLQRFPANIRHIPVLAETWLLVAVQV